MKVEFAEDEEGVQGGLVVKLTGAETLVLLGELGDAPARRSPKIRQLHAELTTMLCLAGVRDEERVPLRARDRARQRWMRERTRESL